MKKNKLLLFSGSGIGNVIQSTPTIKALSKLGYEVDVVTWFTPETREPILEILLSMKETRKVFSLIEDLPFLRFNEYDKVCMLKLEPPPQIIDYYMIKSLKNFYFVDYPPIGSMNDVELNMILARTLGYKGDIPPTHCPYEDSALPSYDYILAVNCNPNPPWYIKKWPHFNDLISKLKKRNKTIAVVDNYDNSIKDIDDYTYALSFLEKASLIKKAKNVIAIDSGFAHVAAALKTKTYVLFGPTSVIKCKPWGISVFVITNQKTGKGCQRWNGFMNYFEKPEERHKMENITVDQVLEAIGEK